jgi:single-strand DNA-binding protein
MSVNKVIVIGNLGANPEVRALPSGQNVANFSLATTERFTDRNGAKQERTDWHPSSHSDGWPRRASRS